MKHGYSTVDLEAGHDNERPHKMDAETFAKDVINAKAILAKVSRVSFYGYYLACFSKSNNNYAYNRSFIKLRN